MPKEKDKSHGRDREEKVGGVWYATKADPLLALEPVLYLESPDGEVTVLEPVGKPGKAPPSAVEAVLGAAGFLSAPQHPVTLKSHSEKLPVIKHFGFEVSKGEWSAAVSAAKHLAGNLGGWTTVLAGQTAFHAPTHLSEILGVIWQKAGRPAWSVTHASTSAPAHGSGAPEVLVPYALTDLRVRAIEKRFGGLDKGGGGSLMRQKTHLEVHDDLKLSPEACPLCGGRLYEEDGQFFCETAADEPVEPDERMIE